MNPKINWNDDQDIKRVFSYQTRMGLAPKFGSLPISWYQQHQCEINDLLSCFDDIKVSHGLVYAFSDHFESGYKCIGSVNAIYQQADNKIRLKF